MLNIQTRSWYQNVQIDNIKKYFKIKSQINLVSKTEIEKRVNKKNKANQTKLYNPDNVNKTAI